MKAVKSDTNLFKNSYESYFFAISAVRSQSKPAQYYKVMLLGAE